MKISKLQIVTSHNDNFWKTKEQNIDGICEVTYQINELPKYMIRDRPELIPNPELCQGQKYFELILLLLLLFFMFIF